MSDDNNSSFSDSNEFMIGKKKSIKKITKLGKRPYNKVKSNQLKNQSKNLLIYYFSLSTDKNKRDFNFEKGTNYSKLSKDKFLYLPYHPLPDLSDYLGEIIEVKNYS